MFKTAVQNDVSEKELFVIASLLNKYLSIAP